MLKYRKRVSHRELTAYQRHELLTGEIIYPAMGYTGYGDGTGRNLRAFISDEMRADWNDNRDELLRFSSGEYITARFSDSSLGCSPTVRPARCHGQLQQSMRRRKCDHRTRRMSAHLACRSRQAR
jgi:hypothetical protein